jgi:RNA polymerase sigma factor (sigma-70 family)
VVNAFPSTPVSILARLGQDHGSRDWNRAWSSFVELYSPAMRLAAQAEFHRVGWHQQDDHLIDEVVSDAVVKFLKASGSFSYDSTKGRFRNYLRQIIAWCVRDHLTASNHPVGSSDELDGLTDHNSQEPYRSLLELEEKAWRNATLQAMLEEARTILGPQTMLIFEMAKILEQPVEEVMTQLRVSRSTVDNANHRVMKLLKELSSSPDFQEELQ